MSLKNIRMKNMRKDKFVNSKVDYDSLSPEDIECIKQKVFREFVRPVEYKNFAKKKYISEKL